MDAEKNENDILQDLIKINYVILSVMNYLLMIAEHFGYGKLIRGSLLHQLKRNTNLSHSCHKDNTIN